jgi:hypothetical protein
MRVTRGLGVKIYEPETALFPIEFDEYAASCLPVIKEKEK